MDRYDVYDAFAWVYNRHLGPGSVQRFWPIVGEILLDQLPADARILDLCCGTGQLAAALTERGYRVVGVDGSEQMLGHAKANAPGAEFMTADARSFELPATCDAAISAFDSLNHVMSLEELSRVFANVHAGLRDGGRFLLDLNMEEGYKARWGGSSNIVEDDNVTVLTHAYDETSKIATVPITIFRLQGETWRRSDLQLTQRCYAADEIGSTLKAAGFVDVETFDALNDFGFPGGIGRMFFRSRKPGPDQPPKT